jgi:chromosome segregation ATPase
LEDLQAHRSQTLDAKQQDLSHTIEQIQAHLVSLQSSSQTSTERQKSMEGELKQSQESIQVQLDNMSDARSAIDRELEELEKRKHELRMELDEVSKKLDETRMKQRQQMEECDKQRSSLESMKSTVKGQIDTETNIIKDAERERSVVERTQQLVRDTEGVVQRVLGGQLEELRGKQSQFQTSFEELLKEHLAHVETRLQRIQMFEKDEASAGEAAVVAQREFQSFVSEYGDLLKSDSMKAKVEELRSEHAEILEKLSPAAAQTSPSQPQATPDASPTTDQPAEVTFDTSARSDDVNGETVMETPSDSAVETTAAVPLESETEKSKAIV